MAAFIIVIMIESRGLLSLQRERAHLAKLSHSRRWLKLIPHAIWIVIMFYMVTVVGPSFAGREFDLRWFIGFYPDVVIFVVLILVTEIIQMAVKIGFILALYSKGILSSSQSPI